MTTQLPLPIVDFAGWKTPEKKKAVAAELVKTCCTSGFAYIVNHGVSNDELEEAFGWTKKLFDLRHEEKMCAPHPEGGKVHRGYSAPGRERAAQLFRDDGAYLSEEELKKEKLDRIQECRVRNYGPISYMLT